MRIRKRHPCGQTHWRKKRLQLDRVVVLVSLSFTLLSQTLPAWLCAATLTTDSDSEPVCPGPLIPALHHEELDG